MSSADEEPPLAGFTVAVTADRRRPAGDDELGGLLEQYGARVVPAPALRIVPVPDDGQIETATVAVVDRPPDVVVVTTGVGLRGWLEAADGSGLGDALRARLTAARLVARGPEARRAVRAAGLAEAWSPASESGDDVLDYLLEGRLAGRRVAIQLPGEPQPEFTAALRDAGAIVSEIPVYRWEPPLDAAPLRRLVDLIGSRLVDAVTFTSAPAAGSLLHVAGPDRPDVLAALRTDVVAACVGPFSAAPLRRLDVPVAVPARPRLRALVRLLVDELPRRAPTLRVAGAAVTLRGHAAVIDGRLKPLAPGPMAVLRALAASPGRVLSRAALLQKLPRGADEHAVEMAVARLRAALGGSAFVQTVIKRGYRLRVD
jgi:uroporphyrinogen-III synthase